VLRIEFLFSFACKFTGTIGSWLSVLCLPLDDQLTKVVYGGPMIPMLKDWLRQHPKRVLAGILTLITGSASLIHYVRAFEDPFSKFIVRHAITINWKTGSVKLGIPAFIILAVLVVSVVITATLWLRAEILLSDAKKSAFDDEMARRHVVATKTLECMMGAMSRINRQLFPLDKRPAIHEVSVHSTYLINSNFDGDVTRVYEYQALASPVHFCEVKMWVEDEAGAMDYLDDINFKIIDEAGRGMPYIPYINSQTRKEIVVYFLPQLESGQPPRKFTVTYTWPRMFAHLAKSGREIFRWDLVSERNVRQACFEIYMEPGTGKNLDCEFAGTRLLNQRNENLGRCRHPDNHWQGWRYQLADAPSAQYALELVLKNA
jgi:hypothetical protein